MPKIFLLREKLSSNFDALVGRPKGQHEETLSRKYGDEETDDEDELEEVFTRPQRVSRRAEERPRELPLQAERTEKLPETAPGESSFEEEETIGKRGFMADWQGGWGGGVVVAKVVHGHQTYSCAEPFLFALVRYSCFPDENELIMC